MELFLKNLNCADCAANIEARIQKMPYIQNATLNFVSQTLEIQLTDKNQYDHVLKSVIKLINNLEPDVIVYDKSNDSRANDMYSKDQTMNSKLAIVCIGAILFLVAMIIQSHPTINMLLFICAYILLGHDIIIKAIKNIKSGQLFDENFLMTLATLAAFSIGEFAEGVAVMLFYKVGEYFQNKAVAHSRKSITKLMDIRPDYANLKKGDTIQKVDPSDIKIGDFILVKAGEKIPLDGIIVDGYSVLDTKALTGESMPIEVCTSDNVLSGSINQSGLLTIQVTKEFSESTVSKILNLVQNASSKKTETEKFITKFSRIYTPIVVLLALLTAVIPPIFITGQLFSDWIYRAIVFLVISCPCALVISIPLSYFGGIGSASKKGILIKGTNYLDDLTNIETVVFDKTGTLTKGSFDIHEICPIQENQKDSLLEYAAYCESYSNHPIAISIIKSYGKHIDKTQILDYTEISGHGTKIIYKTKEILAGNAKLMQKYNINFPHINVHGTIVHVAVDSMYFGYIVINDTIKEDSFEAIYKLRKVGIKNIIMLTGDNITTAEQISSKLNLDNFYADLLPHEKMIKLEELQNNTKIAFVGDGINDAPVLTQADIGIAMGGVGSDAAIEASDIVLMSDEPSSIVTAIQIAKITKKIVIQNIALSLGIKILAMLLGVFGFANIWEAVIADVGVSILAILNAIRILKY